MVFTDFASSFFYEPLWVTEEFCIFARARYIGAGWKGKKKNNLLSFGIENAQ